MSIRVQMAVVLLLAGVVPLTVFLVALASLHGGVLPFDVHQLLVPGLLVGVVVVAITGGADLLVARPASRAVADLTRMARQAARQEAQLLEEIAPAVKIADATADELTRLNSVVQAVMARLERSETVATDQISRLERELASAKRKLEKESTRDRLTDLLNARAFRERLEQELKRSARSGQPLSVVLFDLDHFQAINETHGQRAGDEVLKRIVRILRDTIRSTDIAARYGDDELAVLLLDASGANAYDLAERIHQLINAETFQGNGGEFHVTASVGLAASDVAVSVSCEELLERADMALHKAKAGGRDRVEAG